MAPNNTRRIDGDDVNEVGRKVLYPFSCHDCGYLSERWKCRAHPYCPGVSNYIVRIGLEYQKVTAPFCPFRIVQKEVKDETDRRGYLV